MYHFLQSQQGDRSEGNMLRRSSRRATIERRVWASPKKMAKTTLPTVKEKPTHPKLSRKDKEKKVQNTVQRSSSKSKVSDTKRGLVTVEEMGYTRRKIKRRDGMQDVSDNLENVSDNVAEVVEVAETDASEDDATPGASISVERTENVTEKPSEICIGGSGGDSNHSGGECMDSIRTGLPLLAEAVVSLNDIPSRTSKSDVKSDRGLQEEMLDTGELCLTKAVVEEVVPDFGNDTSYVSGTEVTRNTLSESQGFRNLEDVLGHSYSKPGQDCDVDDKAELRPVRAYPKTPRNSDNEEAETEHAGSEADVGSDGEEFGVEHDEREGKREEVLEEGDQVNVEFSEAQLDIRLECTSKSSEVTKDESDVDSLVESMVESVEHQEEEEEENSHVLEDDQTEKSVATDFAAQNSDTLSDEQNETKRGEAEVLEEEEEHVSLSVALAQLIDSGCGETEGTETLTIHSVSPSVQAGREEQKEIVAMEVSSRGE